MVSIDPEKFVQKGLSSKICIRAYSIYASVRTGEVQRETPKDGNPLIKFGSTFEKISILMKACFGVHVGPEMPVSPSMSSSTTSSALEAFPPISVGGKG